MLQVRINIASGFHSCQILTRTLFSLGKSLYSIQPDFNASTNHRPQKLEIQRDKIALGVPMMDKQHTCNVAEKIGQIKVLALPLGISGRM